MRMRLLCIGTQGDVQPFMALALGLAKAGHDVTLAAGEEFERSITEAGIEYRPLRVNLSKIMQSEEYHEFLSGSFIRRLRFFRRQFTPIVERTLEDCWRVAQDAEVIVCHPSAVAGPHLAEKLNIPVFAAVSLPVLSPTREFSNPNCGLVNFGGVVNRLTHSPRTPLYTHFHSMVNRWRTDVLGLPRRASHESDLM